MGLPRGIRVEKLVNEVETDWQFMKRFWAEWSVKKVMLTEFVTFKDKSLLLLYKMLQL